MDRARASNRPWAPGSRRFKSIELARDQANPGSPCAVFARERASYTRRRSRDDNNRFRHGAFLLQLRFRAGLAAEGEAQSLLQLIL